MSENFYNETWSDNYPLDYETSRVGFLIAIIVFGLLWSVVFPLFLRASHNHSNVKIWACGWMALLFLFVGSIVMAKYSENAQVAIQYNYLGPMRVKGTTIYQRQVARGCNNRLLSCGFEDIHCCVYQEYAVQVELEWGYDWACPREHDKLCVSTNNTYEPCTTVACIHTTASTTCDSQKLQAAQLETATCAEMLFRTDVNYPQIYNPRDAPGSDWPTWLAFGDCNTCTARFIVPSNDKIQRLKIVGYLFLSTGLGIIMVLLIRYFYNKIVTDRHHHNNGEYVENQVNGSHSRQSTAYGSYIAPFSHGQEDMPFSDSYQHAVFSPDFDY